jgi:hypothetical protein
MVFRSFACLLAFTAGCTPSSSSSSHDVGGDAAAADTGTVAPEAGADAVAADAGTGAPDAGGEDAAEPVRTYVGRVQDGTDGGTLVALAMNDDRALLFFCSTGATLSELTHWLRTDGGALMIGQPFALSDGVASASGTAEATTASGTLAIGDAASLPWAASLVGADAGVNGLWVASVGDAGTADLIVADPDDWAGALRATSIDQVLQVTPLDNPVSLTGAGIQVQVTLQGVPQTILLAKVAVDSL